MATNVYFSQKVKSEQNLYEDIVIESLKMYGQDIYYLPRAVVHEDTILNEDVESTFDASYTIEMYIESVDGFEGDGDLLSKFGVEIRDQATFIVSRRRWEQLIGIHNNGINSVRPAEGDLLYLPLSKGLFEIRFVEDEQPFYQLSNLPVYKLQCELFEFSGEKFNTGLESLDDAINSQATPQLNIHLSTDNNAIDFIIGENIQQEITVGSGEYITGNVVDFNSVTRIVSINEWATTDGKYHDFNLVSNLVGVTSGASWGVTDVYQINDTLDKEAFGNDNQSQNQEFEAVQSDIIDFSENNPFGDLG
jgi:hypothetical protein